MRRPRDADGGEQGEQRTDAPAIDGFVYGVILNDPDSLAALGDAVNKPPYKAPPRAPVVYAKPYNTLAPSGVTVPLPRGANAVEVRGALAVVFDRDSSHLSEANVLSAVRGYAVALDLCLPHADVYRPPIRETCFDFSLPVASTLTKIADPSALEIATSINGDPVRTTSLRKLIRPIPRLIADLTQFMRFRPGDALLVGVTLDAPRARPGDRVSAEIAGVGEVEARIGEAAR
jgi:5-oxopent-3-ene-1,2,5-tricarboxylate decarboxylase/2-hydroxyhepta-2,4-diene-1,7-dioate isomerase